MLGIQNIKLRHPANVGKPDFIKGLELIISSKCRSVANKINNNA